jgi:hypothetical protein
VLCLLVTALVWAGCWLPSGGNSPGREGDPLLEPDDNLVPSESLAAQMKALLWCAETRRALATEVLAGRLTLPEAAAGFRAVDEVKRQYVPLPAFDSLGQTEEERLCRRVLFFATDQLRQRPDRETVLARLEGELNGLLGRYGGLQLPEFRRPEHIVWFEP